MNNSSEIFFHLFETNCSFYKTDLFLVLIEKESFQGKMKELISQWMFFQNTFNRMFLDTFENPLEDPNEEMFLQKNQQAYEVKMNLLKEINNIIN